MTNSVDGMFLAHIPPKTVTIRIPKGYQMDGAAPGVERVACTILEHLRQKLSDAEIDYESFDGVHNFLIRHDGTRFRVQFTEQGLLRKSPYEIEEAIHKVIERVLCATSSRVFKTAA